MGGAETGDLYVHEAGFEGGGADMRFGDGLLAFGIDDPEGGGAAHGSGD